MAKYVTFIKSCVSPGRVALAGIRLHTCILITKASVIIIDSISSEQNVKMLVWLGKNVLGCL